jgi:hypothetical protein
MNPLRLCFALAGLVLLGLATTPNAVADTASDTSATAVSIGLLQCWSAPWDAQGDGHAETWRECSTPTCGCNCPYVGAGVVVEVPHEDVAIVHTDSVQAGAFVITSGCQTAYGTTDGPGDGGPPATPLVFLGGGGLGPILDLVSGSISAP